MVVQRGGRQDIGYREDEHPSAEYESYITRERRLTDRLCVRRSCGVATLE